MAQSYRVLGAVSVSSDQEGDERVQRMTHKSRNAMHMISLIVGILLAGPTSCGLKPPIHYILPDSYTGVFKIILDEVNGKEIELKNGRYTYEIPENGILRVKSLAPFEPWHEQTAAYRNGTSIVMPDDDETDKVIALRSLGTYDRAGGPRTMAFVIGTAADADRFRKLIEKPEFDNIPPQPTPQR